MEFTVKLNIDTDAIAAQLVEVAANNLNNNINDFLQHRFGGFPQLIQKTPQHVGARLELNPHFQTGGFPSQQQLMSRFAGRFGPTAGEGAQSLVAQAELSGNTYPAPEATATTQTPDDQKVAATETATTAAPSLAENLRFMNGHEVVQELMNDEYVRNKFKDILQRKISSFIANHDL